MTKHESENRRRAVQEMRRLFGEVVVYMATITDPIELDLSEGLMDRIHDAADRLLALREKPAEQARYVKAMPFSTRLVLCMWLMDMSMATRLVRAVYAKG